ncbi:MAG: S1 RNA-binding domain-containing protein [Planctomycetes bacterium]|nr:S1 RNA-binding domain-containing protein [Planctomycetota bacterium]
MSGEDSEPKDSIEAQIEASLQNLGDEGKAADEIERAEDGPTRRKGLVVGVRGKDVFVELGPRTQGLIALSEFEETPAVGAEFEFDVVGQEDDLYLLSRGALREEASWRDLEPGSLIKAKVVGQNTGGLELKIGPLAAFMPASHVALHHVEDLAQFIGQTMNAEVLEVDRKRKRVLISRRVLLKKQVEVEQAKARSGLVAGQLVHGKVVKLESFGAFVEIRPGVEGLLHISNMARRRVEDPSEVVAIGQELDLKILEIKEGGRRIGLGLKQLEPDPWDEVAERFPADTVVTGKVTRTTNFGAFVELMAGIEGLVHISQLGGERGRPVHEVAKAGQELTVRVQSVDLERQRISLSRLDRRGNVIGTVDEAEDDVLDEVMRKPDSRGGVNLGDLLRKALGD